MNEQLDEKLGQILIDVMNQKIDGLGATVPNVIYHAKQSILQLITDEKIKEMNLLMDRYTAIARKPGSIPIMPLIVANRTEELKEGAIKMSNEPKKYMRIERKWVERWGKTERKCNETI